MKARHEAALRATQAAAEARASDSIAKMEADCKAQVEAALERERKALERATYSEKLLWARDVADE